MHGHALLVENANGQTPITQVEVETTTTTTTTYLFHHFPDEHALVVVVLDLLVEGINHQLLGAVAMEALEAEHIGQCNHVDVATLCRRRGKGMRSNAACAKWAKSMRALTGCVKVVCGWWCEGWFSW